MSELSSADIKVSKLIATERTVGFLFNPDAWWVGSHWSKEYKCRCINILPCLTIWIVEAGGKIPRSSK